jgi:hypothetical protein
MKIFRTTSDFSFAIKSKTCVEVRGWRFVASESFAAHIRRETLKGRQIDFTWFLNFDCSTLENRVVSTGAPAADFLGHYLNTKEIFSQLSVDSSALHEYVRGLICVGEVVDEGVWNYQQTQS